MAFPPLNPQASNPQNIVTLNALLKRAISNSPEIPPAYFALRRASYHFSATYRARCESVENAKIV
jgi:hypothetical protein